MARSRSALTLSLLRFIFATPAIKRDKVNLRLWFVCFCTYLTVVTAITLAGSHVYTDSGSTWGQLAWWLGLYVFYFSLACTFLPLPTSWFVLYLASPLGPIAIEPILRVVLVAAIGAFGTAVANTSEYHLICYLLRFGRTSRVTETRIYKWAERIFKTSPFMLQTVFNVLPLPADPVRWLAIIYGYPVGKFFLAQWAGRFIRYGLMAFAAAVFELTLLQIVVIQCALVVAAILKIVLPRIRWVLPAARRKEEQAT